MELALGHFTVIIGSFAISKQWFEIINNGRRRRNKKSVKNITRWIIFVAWILFGELYLGIATNNVFGGGVLDFCKLYFGSASYREEKNSVIEDWSDDWNNVQRDDDGKYLRIHRLVRFRIRKNDKDICMILEKILNGFKLKDEKDYNLHVVEDGVEIYYGKEKRGKAYREIGVVFSYIYIEWDYIRRINSPT
jgi:hypothetical protein